MPPRKRSAEETSSDSKKPRTSTADAAADDIDPTKVQENQNGEQYVSLSKTKRVYVSEFKGKVLVHIRDHYLDKSSGEMKPGKGIALTPEQWELLKKAVGTVDGMLDDFGRK